MTTQVAMVLCKFKIITSCILFHLNKNPDSIFRRTLKSLLKFLQIISQVFFFFFKYTIDFSLQNPSLFHCD